VAYTAPTAQQQHGTEPKEKAVSSTGWGLLLTLALGMTLFFIGLGTYVFVLGLRWDYLSALAMTVGLLLVVGAVVGNVAMYISW
jgi:uncharacterized membrane-anchored protein